MNRPTEGLASADANGNAAESPGRHSRQSSEVQP
ncbi:unnamed protein product, partial [Haemonchus placei]|uniref:Uncharacterized protein n=1 Tax=Haemonchus placei TaxID=6290 RepID=A0A0N4X4P9_HAEPC